jgi:hypothetical protein
MECDRCWLTEVVEQGELICVGGKVVNGSNHEYSVAPELDIGVVLPLLSARRYPHENLTGLAPRHGATHDSTRFTHDATPPEVG